MHEAVLQFLENKKAEYPERFVGKRVLEVGSLDINGSPRRFFEGGEYIGIDRRNGPGVDVVCLAHQYKSRKKFDIIVSTEMLEHDKYADKTMANIYKLLKKGGWLIATAANVNRQPHCEEVGEDNFYENISRERVEGWVRKFGFAKYAIEEDDKKEDIRFIFEK